MLRACHIALGGLASGRADGIQLTGDAAGFRRNSNNSTQTRVYLNSKEIQLNNNSGQSSIINSHRIDLFLNPNWLAVI